MNEYIMERGEQRTVRGAVSPGDGRAAGGGGVASWVSQHPVPLFLPLPLRSVVP